MSLAFERTASSRNVSSNNGAGTPTINRRLYANGIPLPTQTLTAPKNGDSSLPTSCQVIALNFCYRRLLFVLACCPLACVIAPVVLNLMLWVLSFASVDLAIFMTWMWDRSLKFAAPSPEKLALARKKNQWKLPLLMFGFSCAIIRFSNLLLDMIAGAMVTKSFGQRFRPHISTIHFSRLNAPMTPLGSGLRPALGLSLIGLAILLRFVGGISIVRASTLPLKSNGVFTDLTSPSASANLQRRGRRTVNPTMNSVLANLILHGTIGFLVGEFVCRPFWLSSQAYTQSYDNSAQAQLLIDYTGIITLASHLLASTLNGKAHELNPKDYFRQNNLTTAPVSKLLAPVFVFAILAPFFSFGIWYCVHARNEDFLKKDLPFLLLFCFFTSLGVGFYAAMIDLAVRTSLCTPGARLQRFVRETLLAETAHGKDGRESSMSLEDEEDYVIDATLYSILHGDSKLVKQIWESTTSKNPSLLDIERYEAERNANAIAAMAKVLLGTDDVKLPTEAFLEEDCLRHSILESTGGWIAMKATANADTSIMVVKKTTYEYIPADRHCDTINYWVLPSPNTGLQPRRSNEPKGLILVRALSAYAGGLGQALIDICAQSRSSSVAWLLPPAAVASSQYAVLALSRCIVQSLEYNKKMSTDWRSSQVSMLIPAALNSAYRLHLGIVHFAGYQKLLASPFAQAALIPKPSREQNVPRADIDERELGKDSPELLDILHAIDGAVSAIVGNLREANGNTHNLNSMKNALDKDCATWIGIA